MIKLPEGIRIRVNDEVTDGSVPLVLAARRMWPAALIVGAMFVIFAGVEVTVARTMFSHSVRDVFDLVFNLFIGFWLLGWSVGVCTLGTLTLFLFSYGESARLQEGHLVYVPRLGPLKVIMDYDLAQVRNIRLENAGNPEQARVRFDYGAQVGNTLGDVLPRGEADRLADAIRGAAASAGAPATTVHGDPAPPPDLVKRPATKPLPPRAVEEPALAVASASQIALVAANLVPLAGVLFFGWNVGTVLLLFWAESAVIGFYTALKIVVVGKLSAIVAVPFFLGHFGGFMAVHFLFIYALFIRGIQTAGPMPGVQETLKAVFVPLWIPLAALFISHGVSFLSNFIGGREYERAAVSSLMSAPYSRIVAMQLTVIFGGWAIMLLHNPVPALVLLVLIKTAVDFTAHRREHLSHL